MENRETKEITAGKSTFTVKTYATAREANTIRQAYFKGSKVEIVGDQPRMSDFNPGMQFEVEQEMIGTLVVSMDGSTENIVERATDLPEETYRELIEQLDALVAKKKS